MTVLLLAAMMLSGCDFVRSSLGRPTSEELEQKRKMIVRVQAEKEARIQAAVDSAMRVEKAKADSVAAVDSIAAKQIVVHTVAELGGVRDEAMNSRYAVVVGAFSNENNALALQSKVRDAGYDAELVHFRRGLVAVAAAGSPLIQDVYRSWELLRAEPFCPSDIWILNNEEL